MNLLKSFRVLFQYNVILPNTLKGIQKKPGMLKNCKRFLSVPVRRFTQALSSKMPFPYAGEEKPLGKMMVDFYDAVQELDMWTDGKGILLKGSDGNFCSGGDLDFVKKINTPDEGFMMSTFMHQTTEKFRRLPMMSVALVEGAGALGGGAELSVACDFRLITETCAGIGFVHIKMGILPAWGGTIRLVEKVGASKAMEILSTGKILSPTECLKLGLVDEIIPKAENPTDFAVAWLARRTAFDAALTRSVKQSVRIAGDSRAEEGGEMVRRIFAPFWGTTNKEALEKKIKHRPC